jgi:hypothetical protein
MTTPNICEHLTFANKVIKKDNREGNHNVPTVSINSYNLMHNQS